MRNQDMRAGRIAKLCKGRKKFRAIQDALENGKRVNVITHTRGTIYDKRQLDMFSIDKSGSVFVQRGKSKDCIDFTSIRISN